MSFNSSIVVRFTLGANLVPTSVKSVKSRERNPVTLSISCLAMTEMSRLTVTLLMHWQITFLIILPLLSAQMHSHLCIEEFQDALRRAHDTSAVPDEIHYQLLKHLPKYSLFLIIPFPKPGNSNKFYQYYYHPIVLTSCICKTMERMVNRRLVWYLESHNLLTNMQCCFRSRRSTD